MSTRSDTRTRMLEAAIAVIEEHGEVEIRVRDVAAQAGVTYASLYHFFGDREGLIEAAQAERFRRAMIEVIPPAAAAIARCRTQDEFLVVARAIMATVYAPDRYSPRWTRVNVLGSALARPRLVSLLAAAVDEQNRALADALREPQRRGWIRRDLDLEMFAAWMTGQTTGRVLVELEQSRFDLAAWDRVSMEAVLAVLTGLAPGADVEQADAAPDVIAGSSLEDPASGPAA